MTEGNSVFSCINPQGGRNGEELHAPPPVPPLPPPPPPKQHEDLCAKVAALEAKIKRLEERDCAAAAAAEGFKTEAQAARSSAVELEREISGLKKTIEDSCRNNRAGQDTTRIALGELKEELGSQRARVGSIDKIIGSLDPFNLSSLSLSIGLLEGRLKNLEVGLADEFKERFSTLDAAFGETARKAGLAQETAAGGARHIEKLEERVARLPYLENRLKSCEDKLERIYDMEALAQSLKSSVEGMEKSFSAAMRESSLVSAEHKKICLDFESLSRQVKQLTALFNQFRTELAFLMPKKQESSGR